MNNEQLIKDIDEIIMTNRVARQFAGTEMAKDSLRKSNDVLSKARIALKNKDGGYEKGLNDAWDLAQKIGRSTIDGGYAPYELFNIFGTRNTCSIFDELSYHEALAKVQEYEEKKAEESKLVPGDVVEFESMCYGLIKGIFIKYENNDSKILTRQGAVTLSGNNVWKITKTGEHVDISGLIGVLYE